MGNLQSTHGQPATSVAVPQGPGRLPTAESPFPLTSLPLEIQLRILSHCTIIKKPLNLGFPLAISNIDRKASHSRLIQEIGIIYTCRLYQREGTRLLMRNNDFVYTRSDDEWSRAHGTSQLRALHEWQPKPAPFTQIQHLTLRHIGFLKRYWELETVLFLIHSMEQLPALKTVGLDFLVRTGDPAVDPFRYVILKEARWFCTGFRQYIRDGPPMVGRCLDEVTITGLTHDDMGYLALKLASTLVRPEGYMGLQVGLDTGRHRYMEIKNVMRVRDARGFRLEWVPLAEVESWINNRRALPYPPLRHAWRGFETKTRAWRLSQYGMDTYSLHEDVDMSTVARVGQTGADG